MDKPRLSIFEWDFGGKGVCKFGRVGSSGTTALECRQRLQIVVRYYWRWTAKLRIAAQRLLNAGRGSELRIEAIGGGLRSSKLQTDAPECRQLLLNVDSGYELRREATGGGPRHLEVPGPVATSP